MKPQKNFFPVGATYAPLPKATEVDPSEWPADLERFAKLGLTTFRVFFCWDRVEQKRGVRDFSKLDLAFDLALKNNLKVIGNIGGTFTNIQAIYPPRWLVYDFNCTLLKPKPDSCEELHSNRFKLCYDDPVLLREAKDFIQAAVARYKNHPALIAWSGWNEPRTSECYCAHSIAAFRAWLKKKYSDLDTLAKAWSTEFPVYFRTWEDVFPQQTASFEDGGYIPFLDWRAFIEQNRTDKFHLVRGWIKDVDPVTPVISHMCGPGNADIFGQEDILGTSVYTIHAQGKTGDFSPWDFARRNHVYDVQTGFRPTREDPEGFWVVETEAGPVSWVHNLMPRSYSGAKCNARDMMFIAYGARAVLRWLYRSRISDAQAGEFNLVGWDGRLTDRATDFGRLSRFLNAHHADFLTHTAEKSGVVIWTQEDWQSYAEAEGYSWRYNERIMCLYDAFLHIGVRPEIRNTRQLSEGALDGAKVLYLTFCPYVSPELLAKFRTFVENGGTILAESPFAIKDTRCIHYELTPGKMTDVFGAEVYDMEKLDEPTCGGIPAFDFRAKIQVRTATVEARFQNGDPAIVSNRFGKGAAILYASNLANAYLLEKQFYADQPQNIPVQSWAGSEPFRAELRKRLADAGVDPMWRLSGIDMDRGKNLQIFKRRLPDGTPLVFAINMDDRANAFTLAFDGCRTMRPLEPVESDVSVAAEGDALNISLPAWGWVVLKS